MLPRDVSDLLPQKSPFKMVDLLHEATETFTRTSFTILSDNVMVDAGLLTEGGMIENMAQSAAAGSGYFFSMAAHDTHSETNSSKEIPIGYIGAVKNVSILKQPAVGNEISTELLSKHKIGKASIVDAKIFFQKELLGSCELTIFVQ